MAKRANSFLLGPLAGIGTSLGVGSHLVACLALAGCGAAQWPRPPEAVDWVAERDVVTTYGLDALNDALAPWCEATAGHWCPRVLPWDPDGPGPNLWSDPGQRADGISVGKLGVIVVRLDMSRERLLKVLPHEVGHAIGLRFNDGCDRNRYHSCFGLMSWDGGGWEPGDPIDELTLDAYRRVE